MANPLTVISVVPNGAQSSPVGIFAQREGGFAAGSFADVLTMAQQGDIDSSLPLFQSGVPLTTQLFATLLAPGQSEDDGEPASLADTLFRQLADLISFLDRETDTGNSADLLAWLEAALASLLQPAAQSASPSTAEVLLPASEVAAFGQLPTDPKQQLRFMAERLIEAVRRAPEHPQIGQIVQSFEQTVRPMLDGFALKTDATGDARMLAAFAAGQASGSQAPLAAKGNLSQPVVGQPSAEQSATAIPTDRQNPDTLRVQTHFGDALRRLEAMSVKPVLTERSGSIEAAGDRSDGIRPRAESPVTANGSGLNVGLLQPHHLPTIPLHHTVAKSAQPVVHADQLVRDLSDMLVKQMQVTSERGFSEVKLTLVPEHLGHVDVKVSMQNGQIVAQFLADTAHGRELLESQLGQLRAVLQSQGLQIDKLEVGQSDSFSPGLFQEQRQNQPSWQFERRPKASANGGYEASTDDFDVAWEYAAVGRAVLSGSSFDVSA
jgi:flagellar hook-length control protein FliK